MRDCLSLNCEKKKSSHSSENLLTQSNSSTRGIIQKLKSKKTEHSSSKTPPKEDSNSISTADSDTMEVIEVPKKRATQSTQSLATLGRAYGNNISKQYILKASPRPHSTHNMRESWHTSSKTESREYGDYFSWQTGLSFLETHRMSIIDSKGIQHFVEEYMKKLQRCQIFERGHNVKPFASIRLDLLNKAYDDKNSRTSVVCDSVESDDVYKSHGSINKTFKNKNAVGNKEKDLPVTALKTIELLRKFKHGKSVEADLQMSKTSGLGVNKNSSRQRVTRSGSLATTNSNQNLTTQNQKRLTKQSVSDTRAFDDAKTKEIDQWVQNVNEKSVKSTTTPSYGIKQDLMTNLQLSDQKANISQISNSLSSQSSFLLQKKFSLPSEDDKVRRYFSSKRSLKSREHIHSIKTLYRSEASLKDENIAANANVGRRKSK